MSLRWRFALILAGIAIVVTAVAGASAIWNTRAALNGEVDRFLAEGLSIVNRFPTDRLVRNPDNRQPLSRPNDEDVFGFGRDRGIVNLDSVFQINTAAGDLLLSIEHAPTIPPSPGLGESTREGRSFRDETIDGVPYRVAAVELDDGVQAQIARDISDTHAIVADLRSRILAVGILIAAVAAAAGWLIARRTARPVEQLSATARRVAETQDLDAPIEVKGDDEVGQLAHGFNAMLAALRGSREQQQRLVMDASHELRTPLTSLRTNIEVLQRAPNLPDADRAEILHDVDLELRELSGLVTELVELATDRRNEEPSEGLSLGELTETVVERFRRRTGRDIRVVADASRVRGRPGQLDRAVSNLLDNADKWSPAGSPIDVSLEAGRLVVTDDGPGFEESDLPKVFERFYRSDEARNLPGSGLGLAIVAQIVEAHDGTVFASNSPGSGAEVGFEIPLDAG